MASASCSPAIPAKVYDRSKLFGPSTLISQFSLARDPAIDTRHSPDLALSACSIRATISRHSSASPRFCSSIVTPIALQFYRRWDARLRCKPGKSKPDGPDANLEQAYSQFMLKTGERQTLASVCARNGKGCDIGYAPAICSCERAHSVDICTVAALDAIAAFAVPNPSFSSQSQPVFSGLVAPRVALRSGSLSLLRTGKFHFANPFSRRRKQN
jgi:hypothetical protein